MAIYKQKNGIKIVYLINLSKVRLQLYLSRMRPTLN